MFICSRSLRSSSKDLLQVKSYSIKTYGARAFSNIAPRLWNSLPHHIRKSLSVNHFKASLKTHLFETDFVSLLIFVVFTYLALFQRIEMFFSNVYALYKKCFVCMYVCIWQLDPLCWPLWFCTWSNFFVPALLVPMQKQGNKVLCFKNFGVYFHNQFTSKPLACLAYEVNTVLLFIYHLQTSAAWLDK